MINSIQEKTLGELLGIEDPQLSTQMESEMVEAVIGFAISRLSESLDEPQRESLQLILDTEDYDVDTLLATYPTLLDFIAQESYIYKKNALITQASEIRASIIALQIPEETKKAVLGNLEQVLRGINDDSNEAQFDDALDLLQNIKAALAS